MRLQICFHSERFSGTIKYQDLFKNSSDSDVTAIEKLQSTIAPDSGLCLGFTSGTTGQPKAAINSHLAIINSGNGFAVRLELNKQPTAACSMFPFFHVAGTVTIPNTMLYGSTLVLPAPHFNAELTLKTLAKLKCQRIYAAPSSEKSFPKI